MIRELPQLDIFGPEHSKRLFFGKTRTSDSAWHILDFAMSQIHQGQIYSTALHYEAIHPAVRADSIEEIQALSRDSDFICTDCLRELDGAKEIIKNRRLMTFDKHLIDEKA